MCLQFISIRYSLLLITVLLSYPPNILPVALICMTCLKPIPHFWDKTQVYHCIPTHINKMTQRGNTQNYFFLLLPCNDKISKCNLLKQNFVYGRNEMLLLSNTLNIFIKLFKIHWVFTSSFDSQQGPHPLDLIKNLKAEIKSIANKIFTRLLFCTAFFAN